MAFASAAGRGSTYFKSVSPEMNENLTSDVQAERTARLRMASSRGSGDSITSSTVISLNDAISVEYEADEYTSRLTGC